jgi:septal ring factor EnvC (AmiA/AmiB activator)
MEELIQPQMGLNFEQVWAALMENRQQMKETDRLIRELRDDSKETDQRMKETDRLIRELRDDNKETDRQMKETDRRMKELQKSMGDLVNAPENRTVNDGEYRPLRNCK